MDRSSLGDPSVIVSASSRFAGLDLNGKVVHPMETDFYLEVPDTPDRMTTRNKGGAVARGDAVQHRRWRGHLGLESGGNNRITLENNSQSRRENFSARSRSRESRYYPLTNGGTAGPKNDLHGNVLKPCQQRASEKNEQGRGANLIGMGPRTGIGSSCNLEHLNSLSEFGNDVNRNGGHDLAHEVILLDSSSQVRPLRKMIKDTDSKLPIQKIQMEKGISMGHHVDLNCNSQSNVVQDECMVLDLDCPSKTTDKKLLTRNGCISPYATQKGICIDSRAGGKGGKGCSSKDFTHPDKGKGIKISSNCVSSSEGSISSPFDVNDCSRIAGQRKLVRNGCISPANIARSKAIMDESKDVDNNSISMKSLQVNSFRQMHRSAHREDHRTSDQKGKDILDEGSLPSGQELKVTSSSSRLGTTPLKSNAGIGETDKSISWFVKEPRWITTGNRKTLCNGGTLIADRSSPSESQVHESNLDERGDLNMIVEIDNFGSVPLHVRGSPSNPVEISPSVNHDPEGSKRQDARRIVKGKRKSRSSRIAREETSVTGCSNLSLHMSVEPFSTGSSNAEGQNFFVHPVIDVDTFSSLEQGGSSSNIGYFASSDGPSGRALQVESDEIFARQLQEQLFNELPEPQSFEIDAIMAWNLQEEDALNRSSARIRHQSQQRAPSPAPLYRRYPRNSSRNFSSQFPRQHPRSAPRISQLRRTMNRHHMDLEARLNYLEALEAAFNDSNEVVPPNPLLHVERDFNENDYEMLLALDSDNHSHAGASRHQINSLPMSVVQTENPEEPCVICLDVPCIGDTIRHLPCLHKFHKDCIDRWLQRKTSCPVCKSGIT